MQLQMKLKEVELQKMMSSPSESPPITSTSFDAEIKLVSSGLRPCESLGVCYHFQNPINGNW